MPVTSRRRIAHPDPAARRFLERKRAMAVAATMPVLIVDDYNTMIRVVRNWRRRWGLGNNDEANDTAQAKMRSEHYVLVISHAAATKPEPAL